MTPTEVERFKDSVIKLGGGAAAAGTKTGISDYEQKHPQKEAHGGQEGQEGQEEHKEPENEAVQTLSNEADMLAAKAGGTHREEAWQTNPKNAFRRK